MSARDHDELDLIAAEYVLGTLPADEAAAFRRRLAEDATARACVAAWQDRLGQLGCDLDPVEPPPAVWRQVLERTGIAPGPGRAGHAADPVRGPVERWRRLAVAASVAAVLLAGALAAVLSWHAPGAGSPPQFASVIYDQPTGMSWLVTSADHGRRLSVEAMGNFRVPADKMLRMWIKPSHGKPYLIGQLPHSRGHYSMALPAGLRGHLGAHSEIMVSMEDRSRAGTTTPGGKLMWVAPLASLGAG